LDTEIGVAEIGAAAGLSKDDNARVTSCTEDLCQWINQNENNFNGGICFSVIDVFSRRFRRG
jgi:hypothetical protein